MGDRFNQLYNFLNVTEYTDISVQNINNQSRIAIIFKKRWYSYYKICCKLYKIETTRILIVLILYFCPSFNLLVYFANCFNDLFFLVS